MQPRSMRVDPVLYDRLSDMARSRGTTITRQLELAIRRHLEGALVEDHLPVIQPGLRKVIEDGLEATVMAKIDEMKERLASLLARNAIDTACVYLLQTSRMDRENVDQLRSHAARHVRGKMADFSADKAAAEELESLRRQVRQLASDLEKAKSEAHQAGQKAATAEREHRAEADRLKYEIGKLHQVIIWRANLLKWIEAEWDKQGLLSRRRPLQECVAEFTAKYPRPEGA